MIQFWPEIPEGWRLRRIWNHAPPASLKPNWMAELQRGTLALYVSSSEGGQGHATPIDALQAVIRKVQNLGRPA